MCLQNTKSTIAEELYCNHVLRIYLQTYASPTATAN